MTLRWRMAALAALCQNVAVGITFGAFGTLVMGIEQRFASGRAMSSLGIALITLTLALLGPASAALIRRFSIRAVMALGAVMLGSGYLLMAISPGIYGFLAICGLLIGPGIAFLGLLPASLLATNWFETEQGRAMGIVTMPVLVMITPLVTSRVLEAFGLTVLLIAMGVAHLLVLPLLPLVIDRPEAAGSPDRARRAEIGALDILRMPRFWLVTACYAVLVTGGVFKAAHLVPLAVEQGITLNRAALLLSLSGGTGVIGALLFGWLADRIGPMLALAANCLLQALVWMIFLQPVSFALLAVDAVVVGACAGGFMAAFGVLFRTLFGREGFAPAMGLSAFVAAPISFVATPLAGWLYELHHNYHLPVAFQIGCFAAAALVFLGLHARLHTAQNRNTP